jgi:tetratricopeptide (TPR) repeat protein
VRALFGIIASDESKLKMNTSQVGMIDFFPTKKFMVTYDPATIMGHVPASYAGKIDTLRWEINRQAVEKNSLMILDLLAANNWKRPVYFVMTTGADTYIGLEKYFHLEGLAYRLLPVTAVSTDGQLGDVNTAVMYDNLMNKFKWGNLGKPGVYLDENNSRMFMNFRSIFGRLTEALIREGKLDSAKRVLDRCIEVMPDAAAKYDFFAVPIAEGYYKVGEVAKANAIAEKLTRYSGDELAYYFSFPDQDLKAMDVNMQEALFTLQRLSVVAKQAGQEKIASNAETTMKRYYDQYIQKVYQQGNQ